VEAACSPRIDVAVRAPAALVQGNFYKLVPNALKRQRAGFSAIARACQRGDGQQAADEYAKMMRGVAGEVVRLFRRRGLFEPSR
jgi:hypothetical protein